MRIRVFELTLCIPICMRIRVFELTLTVHSHLHAHTCICRQHIDVMHNVTINKIIFTIDTALSANLIYAERT
jgi:hypothetical protein